MRLERPVSASTRIVAVGVLLVAAVMAASVAGSWEVTPRFDPGPAESASPPSPLPTADLPTTTASEPPVPAEGGTTLPDLGWLLWVGGGVLALVVLALLVRAVLWLRRPTPEGPDPAATLAGTGPAEAEPDIPVLHRGARAAALHLERIGPPRDAIVAAWLTLEEAAQASGVRRRPAQTPTEFTAAVLTRTGTDADGVTRLLRLYHGARFSTREPGAAEVAAAIEALEAITRSWPSEAADPAGPEQAQDRSGR
ncbi:DUF4129 domain-containing protein [Ruania suaedae]|uniref:DUF4129 domain-containing protein n=1 Tax=Ruania suaedae TaxID=2897774 RepID=UPI001E32CE8E|nr:DUF4129 domain-containing protein [Ruania suaedae]UFU03965.1 DUF4129 domain-containing protein [Ruania suaedae]